MYHLKDITDKINEISLSRGHREFRWIINHNPSKNFVVNSVWLSDSILSVTFGRVLAEDIFWLTIHELCHYEVAPDAMKKMDNFGMPCDDVDINKQSKLKHEDCHVFEKQVMLHLPTVKQYLSEKEYIKMINFKV